MTRRLRLLVASAVLVLSSIAAHAAGPERIALMNRSSWPMALSSPAAFDRASRAEILVLAAAITDEAGKDGELLKQELRLKQVDTAAIRKTSDRLLGILLANYTVASRTCTQPDLFCPAVTGIEQLAAAGRGLAAALPQPFGQWLAESRNFHRLYAMEIVRLASLFPSVSSEIETYGDGERTGLELADRHFQFSFDDGPTARGGTTDTLLPILAANDIHAHFYMLGERLTARVRQDGAPALRQSYAGQCAALHGWEHKSHQKWAEWQDSVLRTRNLSRDTFGDTHRPWFRPPYGQRTADSGAFFAANGVTVALWNIDSQDWNAGINAEQAADRVVTLMLAWRRGTILFHDVHPKAAKAVPALVQGLRGSGVVWEDCRGA